MRILVNRCVDGSTQVTAWCRHSSNTIINLMQKQIQHSRHETYFRLFAGWKLLHRPSLRLASPSLPQAKSQHIRQCYSLPVLVACLHERFSVGVYGCFSVSWADQGESGTFSFSLPRASLPRIYVWPWAMHGHGQCTNRDRNLYNSEIQFKFRLVAVWFLRLDLLSRCDTTRCSVVVSASTTSLSFHEHVQSIHMCVVPIT